MPNGEVHTGKAHSDKSQKLFHFEELSDSAKKKAKGSKAAPKKAAKKAAKKMTKKEKKMDFLQAVAKRMDGGKNYG